MRPLNAVGRTARQMSIELVYKLNGAMEEGVNVYELSPFLLSFAEVISAAHKALYPSNRDIAVNVRPFQKGSFLIDIVLLHKDALGQLAAFLASEESRNTLATLTYLGFIQGASGVNLVNLVQMIKSLAGHRKPIVAKPLASGDVRYEASDGASITVPQQVSELYQNCNVQKHFYIGVAKPLEIPGVSSTESYLKSDEATSKVMYDDVIVEPIRDYSSAAVAAPESEQFENTRKVYVHPKRVSLEGEKGNWSFRIGEGDHITASVHDEAFLEKVKHGFIRLSSADLMRVELVEKQTVRPANASATTTYEIAKVVEYTPAPAQGKFNLDSD